MRRSFLYAIVIITMALLVSCNYCTSGNADCETSLSLHVLNRTKTTVLFDDISIESMGTAYLGNVVYVPFEYFDKDTVVMVFNDSVVMKHMIVRTDSCVIYVPPVNNILDNRSWYIEFYDDSFFGESTYTITEEDYQRALEQNEK